MAKHTEPRWDEDERVLRFLEEHPDGGQLGEIAQALELHIQSVFKIYRRAIRKAAAAVPEDLQ